MTQLNFEINVLESRGDFAVCRLSLVGNLHLFNRKLVFASTVLTELGC
jgi:hypothetical protein